MRLHKCLNGRGSKRSSHLKKWNCRKPRWFCFSTWQITIFLAYLQWAGVNTETGNSNAVMPDRLLQVPASITAPGLTPWDHPRQDEYPLLPYAPSQGTQQLTLSFTLKMQHPAIAEASFGKPPKQWSWSPSWLGAWQRVGPGMMQNDSGPPRSSKPFPTREEVGYDCLAGC